MTGVLDVEQASNGKYRWTFSTTGGALHLGPGLYRTASAAKSAGRQWIKEQQQAALRP